jgi:ABC-type xylose transport system substrate-binding protein
VSLGGVALATLVAVGGNDSTVIDIKQVLTATQTITVNASATTVSFHISGVEIS